MLDDWFPDVAFPIPIAGFHELPKHPAYKWEYWDGQARLSARPKFAHCLLAFDDWPGADEPLGRRDQEFVFRPLAEGDRDRLPSLLAAAFHRVPPFSQLERGRAVEAARDCLDRTRAGEDGPPLDAASLVAVAGERIVGGMIVTLMSGADPEDPYTWWGRSAASGARPHLTWAFVSPRDARRGVGSALLGRVIDALRGLGYAELASTFLIGNESSALWHWRNGFRLMPGPDSLRAFRKAAADRRADGAREAEQP